MTKATHIMPWDANLTLNHSPVLFAEFDVECSVEEGHSGPFVKVHKIHMDTGFNGKTGKLENEICLEVPGDHTVKEQLLKSINEEDYNKCFDLLFAFMASLEMRKDEMLMEKMS